MIIYKYIPSLRWLSNYDRNWLRGDLFAGLTVGVMLIPQSMAYAMLAGLPPIHGLYVSIIPLLLYAILGTSQQLAVGPVALISFMTFSAISTIVETIGGDYLSLVIILAAMVGLIQLIFGILRLGFIANFLSLPVISGFTSAAAIIIAVSQLKHILGISVPNGGNLINSIGSIFSEFGNINFYVLGLGAFGILLIYFSSQWKKAFPGSLIAVIIGLLAVHFFDLEDLGVATIGTIPSDLPEIKLPELSLPILKILAPTALAIALISFVQSIAVAKALKIDRPILKLNANQELIAVGFANLGSALCSGFPLAGGFARSAVNKKSGANTGLATMISAVLIFLTLLFLTSIFEKLPYAILGSIVLVAVSGLLDFATIRRLWKNDIKDFFMLIATLVGTLFLGIEWGLAIGVLLSLGMVIFNASNPHFAELARVPNTRIYRNTRRFKELERRLDVLIFRFDAPLFFANIHFFSDKLQQKINSRGQELKYVILKFDSINSIDSTSVEALNRIINDGYIKGLTYLFTGVKGPIRDKLKENRLTELIGFEHFFFDIHDALDFIDQGENQEKSKRHKKYILQTNVTT